MDGIGGIKAGSLRPSQVLGTSGQITVTDNGNGTVTLSLALTLDALKYKGVINCSANPNYPAADAGDVYVVSVAGKIGGASGTVVVAGDTMFCNTDGTAAGDQATVGTKWNILEKNIDLTNISITGGTITGITDLVVADGGTGASTLTDHGILLGSGTDPITALSVGTNGQLLKGVSGADSTWSTTVLTDGSNTYTLACGTGSLVVETGNSIVNQDLTTDASPTFTKVTAPTAQTAIADTTLSGAPKVFVIYDGTTPYYFKAYPTKP